MNSGIRPTFTAALATALAAGALIAALPAAAQQSASYRLEEHAFNSGGTPTGGVDPASAGFRISLSSLGDGGVRTGLSSASFRSDAAFVSAYRPPAEVNGLTFTDGQTLAWNGASAAGTYNLYRDALGSLSGGGYGACFQQDLTTSSAVDAEVPTTGQGFFYLITVENRLREEGTKGFDGDGTERTGTACP